MEHLQWKAEKELKIITDIIDEATEITPEELECQRQINAAKTEDDLFKLMRKPMSGRNRKMLNDKILEYEEMMLPYIKEKAIRSGQDYFIENACRFFIRCGADCCEWIMEEYRNVRNEYMKSLLCLVLGIRGNENVIPFLVDEVVRFEYQYPPESFEQGPLIGLAELLNRLEEKNRRYFA